jgi:hypothetical protein
MSAPTPTAGSAQPRPDEVWVTRHEAAALCALSFDTIRRCIEPRKLLRSRKNAKGVVEVPVADLVAARLLDPLAAGDGVAEVATRSRAERDLVAARQQLAVIGARLDAAVERAERAEAEIAFLRTLVTTAGRGT